MTTDVIDYAGKIGFKFNRSGTRTSHIPFSPTISYEVSKNLEGLICETLYLFLKIGDVEKILYVLHYPADELLDFVSITDGGLRFALSYTHDKKIFSHPALPEEDALKIFNLALKKFADSKEQYGINKLLEEYDVNSRMKDAINLF